MRIPISLTMILLVLFFGGCCDPDIVVADFQLTEIAKSHMAKMADTVIYVNGNEELRLNTNEGIVQKDTTLNLVNLCSNPPGRGQWEIANTEYQEVAYFHENGSIAFEYALEIKARIDDSLELDSFNIFESIYANVNIDKDQRFNGYKIINFHVNDIQNTFDESFFNASPFVADTILNGTSYSNVYANRQGSELYYTVEEGIIAFQYLNKMWYLSQ